MASELPNDSGEHEGDERLVLGDLLNHVLDKGVVISGHVTISIANIDLLLVDLRLLLTSVQTVLDRPRAVRDDHPPLLSRRSPRR